MENKDNENLFEKIQLIQDVTFFSLFLYVMFFLVGVVTSILLVSCLVLDFLGLVAPTVSHLYFWMGSVIILCIVAIAGMLVGDYLRKKFIKELLTGSRGKLKL